jgi:hypothetical protein
VDSFDYPVCNCDNQFAGAICTEPDCSGLNYCGAFDFYATGNCSFALESSSALEAVCQCIRGLWLLGLFDKVWGAVVEILTMMAMIVMISIIININKYNQFIVSSFSLLIRLCLDLFKAGAGPCAKRVTAASRVQRATFGAAAILISTRAPGGAAVRWWTSE